MIRAQISVSVDGFAAGPEQSLANPLGLGGERLHDWFYGETPPTDADKDVAERMQAGLGAYVMGRNMFGPVRGEWPDESWTGWWGDEPPYRAPVFVLTHYERRPLEMAGGTTFVFVTDGFDAALARAREAAGSGDVGIAGGASTVRQAVLAGVLDELWLHVAPVCLGGGELLLPDVGPRQLEIAETVASPAATHIRYRFVRDPNA